MKSMLLSLILAAGSQVQAQPAETPPQRPPVEGRYTLRGDRGLLPVALSDDGRKTYIEWGANQALPAVFAVDGRGREEIVDGYMRDGIFTIDRVYARLRFRIDKIEGTASRIDRGDKP